MGWTAPRRLFGQRLRDIRISRKLSQEKLGHLAGLDRNYVGQVERGKRAPGLENIVRLAMALGLRPAALFELFTHDAMDEIGREDDTDRYV